MKKSLLLLLSLAPAALGADLTGRFPAGTKHEEPAAHAPANVSRMYARTLAAGEKSLELPATGRGGMIIWTIPARESANARVSTRLRGPGERGLRRFNLDAAETSELGIRGGTHEVLHLAEPAAASYYLDVDIPDSAGGLTVAVAEPESALTLSTWAAPLSRQPGQPITLHAELRDGDAGVTGARVTARLASPHGKAFATIELTDRGNGVYETTLAELPEQAHGAWQVRFDASGTNTAGTRFARTGSGELVAERGAARLGNVRAEIAGDVLRVSVDADVRIPGAYRLDVFAADRAQNALAWGEGVRDLTVGERVLTLDLPLSDLRTTDGLTFDVRLLGLDEIGVAGRATGKM